MIRAYGCRGRQRCRSSDDQRKRPRMKPSGNKTPGPISTSCMCVPCLANLGSTCRRMVQPTFYNAEPANSEVSLFAFLKHIAQKLIMPYRKTSGRSSNGFGERPPLCPHVPTRSVVVPQIPLDMCPEMAVTRFLDHSHCWSHVPHVACCRVVMVP